MEVTQLETQKLAPAREVAAAIKVTQKKKVHATTTKAKRQNFCHRPSTIFNHLRFFINKVRLLHQAWRLNLMQACCCNNSSSYTHNTVCSSTAITNQTMETRVDQAVQVHQHQQRQVTFPSNGNSSPTRRLQSQTQVSLIDNFCHFDDFNCFFFFVSFSLDGRLLWDFLQQLLNDHQQRYSNYIAWKCRDTGVFKIVDPAGLAKLWGIQKNHLSMNYDKMSRALRYYYRVNILRKVQGERHCYQ